VPNSYVLYILWIIILDYSFSFAFSDFFTLNCISGAFYHMELFNFHEVRYIHTFPYSFWVLSLG
jgi:hypothetical protein